MYQYQHIAHRYNRRPALDPGRLRSYCWLIVDGDCIIFVHRGVFGDRPWQSSRIQPWARLGRGPDGILQLWMAHFSWLGIQGREQARVLEFEQPEHSGGLLIAYHENMAWAVAQRRLDVEKNENFRPWVMDLPSSRDGILADL